MKQYRKTIVVSLENGYMDPAGNNMEQQKGLSTSLKNISNFMWRLAM